MKAFGTLFAGGHRARASRHLCRRASGVYHPLPDGSKRAFVIPTNPAVYGVMRMYQLIQNDDPTIKIFRTEKEAREWVKSR